MTTNVPYIPWVSQSTVGQPIATYTLDFTTETQYVFGTGEQIFEERTVRPSGVTVDNGNNNSDVTVVIQGAITVVYRFTRTRLAIPENALTISFSGSGITAAVKFWVVAPPYGDDQVNTQALQNQIIDNILTGSLGVLTPLPNNGFDDWLATSGTVPNTFVAGNAVGPAAWYLYCGTASEAVFSQQPGLQLSRYATQFGRPAGNSSVSQIEFWSQTEGYDGQQFRGRTITLSFTAQFGANFSGTSLTAEVITGTGVSDDVHTGLTGATTIALLAVTPSTSVASYNVSSTVNVASNVNQIGVRFRYNPAGTAGAADYVTIENPQLDGGSIAQSWRHVPKGLIDYIQAGVAALIAPIYSAVTTVSGLSSYDFTGIPAGVTRLVITGNAVKRSASANMKLCLKTPESGTETTGYDQLVFASGIGSNNNTDAFYLSVAVAATSDYHWNLILNKLASGVWTINNNAVHNTATFYAAVTVGHKTLVGSVLNGINLSTSTGTFNGGTVNVLGYLI